MGRGNLGSLVPCRLEATLGDDMNNTHPGTVPDVLRDVFGFTSLRPGQADVITKLLDGRSVLAVFPTGGGKSEKTSHLCTIWTSETRVLSRLMHWMRLGWNKITVKRTGWRRVHLRV